MPLSDYLRLDLGQFGTKVVCAEGDCGACSVMLGRLGHKQYSFSQDSLNYVPVNSCIQFVYQLDLAHLITVEGLKPDLYSIRCSSRWLIATVPNVVIALLFCSGNVWTG